MTRSQTIIAAAALVASVTLLAGIGNAHADDALKASAIRQSSLMTPDALVDQDFRNSMPPVASQPPVTSDRKSDIRADLTEGAREPACPGQK